MPPTPHLTGWAHTRFGRAETPDVEALLATVSGEALDHAEVDPADVDAIMVGVFNAGLSPQGFEAGLVGVGLPALAGTPATRLENACATGSAALFAGLDLIASGRARTVLVLGAEKMTAAEMDVVNNALLAASYRVEEAAAGSFAAIFGGLAEEYFRRYGDHRATLAQIAAKNHANGAANPYAHLQKDLGFDFCNTASEKNPLVAGPLRRTDCSMVSDGAAAVVLQADDATVSAPRAVAWRGRAQAGDHLPLSRRGDVLEFAGARAAFERAMAEAGTVLADLSLLETHDCFTIAELLEYEAFGLAEPGKGATVLESGMVAQGGELPVNVSGGLKAKGHPIGATGVSQHVMAAMQLTGDAGAMQLPDPQLAGVFNMGGAAVANYFSVLERVR
ncbi:thiolase domain-containing protein [Pseudonocardia kunmingensis]|uniref:Acetyl-CoA C-acetyltransferase n=1 Tax=Pseudonocardia kunmingensis TaxID=630975 RepID=A0A543C1Y9_9PSEU|nr:thiolase domain-containing protein [Pseudonocardia kunmingensis]TQL91088.1 acetyl-CoA C-acetyltransferase [Pseudonocardia kunmingensis]